jgi:hypothetical protein
VPTITRTTTISIASIRTYGHRLRDCLLPEASFCVSSCLHRPFHLLLLFSLLLLVLRDFQLHDGRPDNDNRFLTVLFYLNDVYAGGTLFSCYVRVEDPFFFPFSLCVLDHSLCGLVVASLPETLLLRIR